MHDIYQWHDLFLLEIMHVPSNPSTIGGGHPGTQGYDIYLQVKRDMRKCVEVIRFISLGLKSQGCKECCCNKHSFYSEIIVVFDVRK